MFDPELMMDIIRRRNNGMIYEEPDTPDTPSDNEAESSIDAKLNDSKLIQEPQLTNWQIFLLAPVALGILAVLISLLITAALLHLALLPPILIHDWWTRRKRVYARRRRVLKRVSPNVRHKTKSS